ncbi:MAG: nucleotidyl transferase AbiEii/AbiGii toxin family protein, partial [Coprobacillus sp.]|nr:nucleotidyl transferase AbiEii/AbiGii toxin family protein [Coprobacillus sp.]
LSSLGPTQTVNISSLVYNANPSLYPDQSPFPVLIYSPVKTYWEKINAIHTCFVKPLSKELESRFSRHLFDIYSLGKTDIKDKALHDLDLQLETVNTSDAFYHYGWLDLKPMQEHDYTLVPPEYRYEEIKEDYEKMGRMIWGEKPSFKELIDYLKNLQDEIKNL